MALSPTNTRTGTSGNLTVASNWSPTAAFNSNAVLTWVSTSNTAGSLGSASVTVGALKFTNANNTTINATAGYSLTLAGKSDGTTTYLVDMSETTAGRYHLFWNAFTISGSGTIDVGGSAGTVLDCGGVWSAASSITITKNGPGIWGLGGVGANNPNLQAAIILNDGELNLGPAANTSGNTAFGTGKVTAYGGRITTGNNTVTRYFSNSIDVRGNVQFTGAGVSTGRTIFTGTIDLDTVTRTLNVPKATTISGALTGSAGVTITTADNTPFGGALTISGAAKALSTNGNTALTITAGGVNVGPADGTGTTSNLLPNVTRAVIEAGAHLHYWHNQNSSYANPTTFSGGGGVNIYGINTWTGEGIVFAGGQLVNLGYLALWGNETVWRNRGIATVNDLPGVVYYNFGSGSTTANHQCLLYMKDGVAGKTFNTQLYLAYYRGAANAVAYLHANQQNGLGGVVLTQGVYNATPLTSDAGTLVLRVAGSNTDNNTLSGAITEANATRNLAITKEGAGRWIFSGANTYTGATTVSTGTLVASTSASPLGAATGAVTVSSGATLEISNGATITKSVALALGTTTAGNGILYSPSGTNSYTASSITMSGANVFTVDSGATLALTTTANIAGAFKITKQGAGTLKLTQSSASTFTQLEVQNGTLEVASNTLTHSLPTGNTAADWVLGSAAAGAKFRYSGANNVSLAKAFTIGHSLLTIEVAGAGTLGLTTAPTYAGHVTSCVVTFDGATGTAAVPNTYEVPFTDNGANAVTLEKTGAGAWKFTQTPTHSGPTRIYGGTVSFNNNTLTLRSALVLTGDSSTLRDVALAGDKTITVNPTAANATTQIITSAAGTNTGNTTILSGKLVLPVEPANSSTQPYKPLGSGAVIVGGGATLKLPRGTNQLGKMSYGGLTLMNSCVLEIGG